MSSCCEDQEHCPHWPDATGPSEDAIGLRPAAAADRPVCTPEPCTNWYGTRRHYSTNLRTVPGGGRIGESLCSSVGNPVDVYDQDWLVSQAHIYRHLGRIVISGLPECKRCARTVAAQRAGAEAADAALREECWPPCAGCVGAGPCDMEHRDECGECALEADHLPSPCEYGPSARSIRR